MSYRNRQELEKTLPRPSDPCIRHVSALCKDAGLTPPNNQDYLFIHRAFVDYLLNTAEGKMTMLKILNAELTPGTYEKQYYPDGYYGDSAHMLDHTKLVEYQGWVYRGRSGPHSKISVKDAPNLVECEGCNGKFPDKDCATITRVYRQGREHIDKLCNHCRMNSDDPKVRDGSSGKVCAECKLTGCPYHPSRHRQASGGLTTELLRLPPPPAAAEFSVI